MNLKVLLIDYTSLQEVMATVPEYIFRKVTEYQELFYVGALPFEEVKSYIEEETFDFILMDFEYACKNMEFFLCQSVCFVTDMQRHHLEIVENIKVPMTMERFLVVKEENPVRKISSYLKQMMTEMKLEEENYFSCPWGEKERKNQMRCQYQYQIPWDKTSSAIKKIIWCMIQKWLEYHEQEETAALHIGGNV